MDGGAGHRPDIRVQPNPSGYLLTVRIFATSASLLPNQQAMWNTMPGCSDPGIVVSATNKVARQAQRVAIQARCWGKPTVGDFTIIVEKRRISGSTHKAIVADQIRNNDLAVWLCVFGAVLYAIVDGALKSNIGRHDRCDGRRVDQPC
ncbi:hypothetical protein [uncultured Novosphingobium sp.]|uniref:hypothetical protein n=1 Tax=uncultured Novosphingobium sp. TaxID=292277 RepID=UPI0037493245